MKILLPNEYKKAVLKEFSSWLADYVQTNNLSFQQASKILGITAASIHSIINGKRSASDALISSVCQKGNKSIAELIEKALKK